MTPQEIDTIADATAKKIGMWAVFFLFAMLAMLMLDDVLAGKLP